MVNAQELTSLDLLTGMCNNRASQQGVSATQASAVPSGIVIIMTACTLLASQHVHMSLLHDMFRLASLL